MDEEGHALPPGSVHPGWMTNLVETIRIQLELSYVEGRGALLAAASIDEWVKVIERAKGRSLHPEERQIWKARFGRFSDRAVREEIGRAHV